MVDQAGEPLAFEGIFDSTLWNFPYHGASIRMPAIFSTSELIVDDTVQKGCYVTLTFCDLGMGVDGVLSLCYSRY